jgi:tRNA pseudouridine55 synthase
LSAVVDGVLLVDKPAGLTSSEVVRRLRRRLRCSRIGHLGTLDPFATGLLPILVGEANKLASLLHDRSKVYEGTIRLGVETDTLDPSGQIIRTADMPALGTAQLEALAARFTGQSRQVPPIFSAIKRDGVRLYELARRGDPIEPPPARIVTISRLDLLPTPDGTIRFTVECSSGTYIRALARDLAVELGTVGSLATLRRLRCGPFSLEQAYQLEHLVNMLDSGESVRFVSPRDSLPDIAECEVGPNEAARLRNGDSRPLDGRVPGEGIFKVVTDGRLIALAESVSPLSARLVRVFTT